MFCTSKYRDTTSKANKDEKYDKKGRKNLEMTKEEEEDIRCNEERNDRHTHTLAEMHIRLKTVCNRVISLR